MKNILCFLVIFFIVACDGTIKNREIKTGDCEKIECIDSTTLGVINQKLLNELDEFIYKVEENNDYKIISVIFGKEDNDCYVTIIPDIFYMSKLLEGYIVLNNKMIAFYNTSKCNENLVDMSKMKKDKPIEFQMTIQILPLIFMILLEKLLGYIIMIV